MMPPKKIICVVVDYNALEALGTCEKWAISIELTEEQRKQLDLPGNKKYVFTDCFMEFEKESPDPSLTKL